MALLAYFKQGEKGKLTVGYLIHMSKIMPMSSIEVANAAVCEVMIKVPKV